MNMIAALVTKGGPGSGPHAGVGQIRTSSYQMGHTPGAGKHIDALRSQGFNHVASSLHGQSIERGSSGSADTLHFSHPDGRTAKVSVDRSGNWSTSIHAK